LARLALADRDLGFTEAVIFDKDGTLCQSQAYLLELARARVDEAMALAQGNQGLRQLLERISGIHGGHLDPAGSTAVASRHDNLIALASALSSEGHSWFHGRCWAEQALAAADARLDPLKWRRTPPTDGLRDLLQRLRSRGVRIAVLSRQLACRPEATGLVGDAADDLQVAAEAGLAWSLAYTGGWQPEPVLAGSHGHLNDWRQLVAR
jgi:phosphoglycolate phosphatase